MENALFLNGYFSPPPARAMKEFFLAPHHENLMGFLEPVNALGAFLNTTTPRSHSHPHADCNDSSKFLLKCTCHFVAPVLLFQVS